MGSTRALLLAGAVALGGATVAHAADLPLPPPPAYYPPAEPVAYGGWYLRGDVGAGLSFSNDIRSSFFDIDTDAPVSLADLEANGSLQTFSRERSKVGDVGFIDFGVGYRVNNWLRFDATGEVRSEAKFSTIEHYGLDFVPDAVPGQLGTDIYHGSVQSSVFLANAYVDIGTWYGVTPYIGGGIGAVYNHMSALTDMNPGTNVNVVYPDGSTGTTPSGFGGGGFADAKGKWNLAYAGMFGFSYDISSNLKLDIGYRYLDLGNVTSGRITCLGGTDACGGGTFYEKQRVHLASNDIRVGLRWLINDYVPMPPPDLPIIRKD